MKRRLVIVSLIFAMTIAFVPTAAFGAESKSGQTGKVYKPEKGADYVEDEVLVVYKDGVTSSEVKKHAKSLDSNDVDVDVETNTKMAVAEVPDGTTMTEAMEEYADDSSVAYVQPNYKHFLIDGDKETTTKNVKVKEINKTSTNIGNNKVRESIKKAAKGNDKILANLNNKSASNKAIYSNPLGAYSNDAFPENLNYQWHLSDIYVKYAKSYRRGLPINKTRVAVLDTGYDVNHEDLKYVNKSLSVDATRSSLPQLTGDPDGHGTHVTGIIGATANNYKGGTGIVNAVAGNGALDLFVCGIFTYDSYDDEYYATSADEVRGLNYARSKGAKVINLSLGSYQFDTAEYNAIQACKNSGATVVCSAGNESTDQECYPAAYSNTISVAALEMDEDGYIDDADYSNYGYQINISAPGTSILSTYPKAMSTSSFTYPGYVWMSGTSQAAPMVSACAALMYIINPRITPNKVQKGLEDGAYDLYTQGWDQYTGYGDVDADNSCWEAVQSMMPATMRATPKLVGANAVRISWNRVSGASKYRVYYKNAAKSGGDILVGTTSGTYLTKKNLRYGSKYRFYVVPCKTIGTKLCEGTGYYTYIYTIKKLAAPRVYKSSKYYTKVCWGKAPGVITGYQVSRARTKTGIHIIKTTTSTSKKFRTTRKRTYYYRVRAYRTVSGKRIYGKWSSAKSYKLR